MTADQLHSVVERLVAAGQWHPGDPDVLIVMDADYDVTRLAFVLADLPVHCSAGSVPTGSCAYAGQRAYPAPTAARPSTGPSSP